MGELADLIGIYGAIDQEVAADSGRREDVGRLLGLYGRSDVRWYDDFVAWTEDLREDGSGGPPFPPLEEALADLAGIRPQGRMRARRLWAVALAARAFPVHLEPDDQATSPLARALRLDEHEDDDDKGSELLDVLGDSGRLLATLARVDGSVDVWWEEVTQEAEARGLLADAEGLGPRPCTGRLVPVALPGGSVPVAALETVFETSRLPFADAIRFLHPETWPSCSPLCCRMRDLGLQRSGLHRFREVVSADCADRLRTWTIEADLDFSYRQIDDLVAVAEYQLAPGPQPDVVVDEGSLAVHDISTDAGPRIRVTTTKRVRFDRAFSGEQLALIMCALGYASIVEDLIFTCAKDRGPGKSLPEHPPEPDVDACVGLATRATRAAEACVQVWAEEVRASSTKVATRRVTPDELVQDATQAWARLLREGAAAIDPRGAGPPAPSPPAGPPAPPPTPEQPHPPPTPEPPVG